MRARKTDRHREVLGMKGGTEDNDLFVAVGRATDLDPRDPCYGWPTISSAWEPDAAERAALAAGALVELTCLGTAHPPVLLSVTREQATSRRQRVDDDQRVWMEAPRDLAEDLIAAIEVAHATSTRRGVPLFEAAQVERLLSMRDTLARTLVALDHGYGDRPDQAGPSAPDVPDAPPEWMGPDA